MHFKDGKANADIGFIEHHLAIEASWAQQGRIKHVGEVRGRDNNDIGLFIKAVQFNEQLVERLLSFVIATQTRLVTLAAYSVDLIDKDDPCRVVFSLFKEIPHSPSSNTYEHLHQFRAADAVESYV